MKKHLIFFLLVAGIMSCAAPESQSSTKSLSKSVIGDSVVSQASSEKTEPSAQALESNKTQVEIVPEVVVKLPLEPSNLQDKMYFGIYALSEKDLEKLRTEAEDEEEEFSNRRLTLRFYTPRGGRDLKADFGDEENEEKSKEAKTKKNLDVKIEGMLITLLDKGHEFLKLEVSKDFKFMFITEDYTAKTHPYTHIKYEKTGMALDGVENNAYPRRNNELILPKLPEYPFKD